MPHRRSNRVNNEADPPVTAAVAQAVANAARNIGIFRDRSKNEGNNKRDRDGHRIRPSDTPAQGSKQRAYDRRDSDRYGNGGRYGNRDRGCGSMVVPLGHRAKGDTRIMPHLPHVTFVGKACHRATGACFECGDVGHLAKDCKKGSSSSRGNKNNKPQVTSGRVFALTTKQTTNAPGFLASIKDTLLDRPRLESHLVVQNFPDVFPDELPRLPLEREVEVQNVAS
nr:hypothetical protein [Tanacetum cinerariifolium]